MCSKYSTSAPVLTASDISCIKSLQSSIRIVEFCYTECQRPSIPVPLMPSLCLVSTGRNAIKLWPLFISHLSYTPLRLRSTACTRDAISLEISELVDKLSKRMYTNRTSDLCKFGDPWFRDNQSADVCNNPGGNSILRRSEMAHFHTMK